MDSELRRVFNRFRLNSGANESEAEDSNSVSSFGSTGSSSTPVKETAGLVTGYSYPKYVAAKQSKRWSYYGDETGSGSGNGNRSGTGNGSRSGNRYGTPSPNVDINRSNSMSKLVPGARSPPTINYPALLNKAAQEIRELSLEKEEMKDQIKNIMKANVDLASVNKTLTDEQDEWIRDRDGLIAANTEFAEEVERLYALEERWEEERMDILTKKKSAEDDLVNQRNLWKEEKSRLEDKVDLLVNAVKQLKSDKEQLIQDKEKNQAKSAKSNEEKKNEYEEKIQTLQSTVSNLHTQLETESEERERLEQDMENIAHELKRKTAEDGPRIKRMEQLQHRAELLSKQLIEAQSVKDEVHKQLDEMRNNERNYRSQIDQMRIEKDWLITLSKNIQRSELHEEVEKLRSELKVEKEKVSNLCTWKGQLAVKNKELQLENERLLSRAEDLEAVLNEEVTDINEVLGLINNIQGSESKLVDQIASKRKLLN